MKKCLLNPVTIYENGNRTSVSLSNVQLNVLNWLAERRGVDLQTYLAALIKVARKQDKRYSRSMGIRDGIIVELFGIIQEELG